MSSNKKSDILEQEEDATDEQDREEDREEDDNDIEDPRSVPSVYLKEIARDAFNTPYDRIAKEMKIPRSQADSIITQFVENMVGTHTERDYPARLLEHYNKFAPEEDDKMTVEDVVILMKLVDRFFTKIKPADKDRILVKMKKMGTKPPPPVDNQPAGYDPRKDAIPPIPPQQQVTFTDTRGQSTQQGPPQQQQPQYPGQTQDPYAQYDSDESLIKYLLESNINIRDPSRIPYFLQWFTFNKTDLLNNPGKLLVALKSAFPPSVAEAVLMQFMDARRKLPTNAASLYQITGASNYSPTIPPNAYLAQINPALGEFINQYAGGMGQFGVGGGGMPPGQGQYQHEAPDPLDKELQRLSKIIGMGMMKNMATGSMPGAAQNGQGQGQGYGPDVDRHEIYDAAGRLSEIRYVKKAYPYGMMPPSSNPNDKTNEMMMKFMELMMTTANEDKKLLMQKLLAGDSQGLNDIINTILKQAVGAMTQTTDPVQNLNKFLELGDKVAQLKQQPQKTVDERKIEMDYILAKNEQQYAEAEKMRQFQREQAEATAADQRYHDTVQEVGNVIKEAAGPILEIAKNTLGRGLGGNMPGVFPPGQGGQPGAAGYPPQQQPQPQQQQERVVVQQVPVPVQPQYTPEQIALLRQEEMRRRQAAAAQMQREQEMDNRPIEEVLGEMSNEEIEEMARRYEDDATRLEYTGNKIMAEAARRKGHGFTAQRKHVPQIVQAIASHEQQQQQAQQYAQQQQQYQQQQQQEEPSINVFEPQYQPEQQESPLSSAIDTSGSYDDDNVKAAMRTQGLLPEDEAQTKSQTNLDRNPSVGTPASASMPSTTERQQEEQELEIDESDIVDNGETTVE